MSNHNHAFSLLKSLIQTPSFSREEDKTASLIEVWLNDQGVSCERYLNNVWAKNRHFDPGKPTLLLNSHHDTVKPNAGYTRDPFEAKEEEGRLYGLGSNDAGASLVSLLAAFVHFYDKKNLSHNLLIAASAEEEISGKDGIAALLPKMPKPELAIVGEPTGMHLAIAEKGLMVIDGYAHGTAGHAAHGKNEDNAIYTAMKDVRWMDEFAFDKVSDFLGPVKMTVSQIEAGSQHNVIPDRCHFVIDVRINEHYTNEEVFAIMDSHTQSELKARSFRLNASGIDPKHRLVSMGEKLGRKTYGSPTLSDQALMPFPSLKMGPGDSTRSHQANEYIELAEIEEGIALYVKLLEGFLVKP